MLIRHVIADDASADFLDPVTYIQTSLNIDLTFVKDRVLTIIN
jgi:hypothetical protein